MDIFEESELELLDEEVIVLEAEKENDLLDARRRLENRLEERRLRAELEDYAD